MFPSCFYIRAICLYLQIKIFPSFLFMWSIVDVAYMWIRILYSTIRQSQCTNCSFTYAENSVLQHQHSLNFPINRARQYSCYREARQYRSTGTFELTFYQKKRGRAFRNKRNYRSFFVLKFPTTSFAHRE